MTMPHQPPQRVASRLPNFYTIRTHYESTIEAYDIAKSCVFSDGQACELQKASATPHGHMHTTL